MGKRFQIFNIVEDQNYNGLGKMVRENNVSWRLAQDTGAKVTSGVVGVQGVCDGEGNSSPRKILESVCGRTKGGVPNGNPFIL